MIIAKKYLLLLIIFAAFVVRICLSIQHVSDPSFFIQQDHYADYADALTKGTVATQAFIDGDKRLLPGYPLLIMLGNFVMASSIISGIVINILLALLIIYLLWRVEKSMLVAGLAAFFPPMWLKITSEVANEPLFIVCCFLGILLFSKKKYFWSGIIIGFSFDVRIIGISLFAAIALVLIQQKLVKKLIVFGLGFFSMVGLLFIFNYFVFGPGEILQQFSHTSRYGGIRLGFIQISQDFYRTLAWKQYKIFLSGSFYVVTNLLALYMVFRARKQSLLYKVYFLYLLFSLLFILTFSPFTLLDDFGRYALAAFPAYIVGISRGIKVVLASIRKNIFFHISER